MLQDIISAIGVGFVLSIMPGAVFFVLLETSVLKGFRAAVAFDLGAISSDIIFILIAYFSSYNLLAKIKDEPALFIFGGIIMLTYGIISFFKVRRTSKEELIGEDEREIIKKNFFSLFMKGFLLNFINVGVLGFWLAIIITWGPKLDLDPSRILIFFIVIIATYFTIDLGKIALAKQLRSRLTVKNIKRIKQVISIILIFFGAALVVQGSFPKKMRSTINRLEHKETH